MVDSLNTNANVCCVCGKEWTGSCCAKAVPITSYQYRFIHLGELEAQRLTNTVTYINNFKPVGNDLKALLNGLSPAARDLLHDMIRDRHIILGGSDGEHTNSSLVDVAGVADKSIRCH